MNKIEIENYANRLIEEGKVMYLEGEAEGDPKEKREGLRIKAAGLISRERPRQVTRKNIFSADQIKP